MSYPYQISSKEKEKIILKKLEFHKDEVLRKQGSSDEIVRLMAGVHKCYAKEEVLRLVSLTKPNAGLSTNFIKEFFLKKE